MSMAAFLLAAATPTITAATTVAVRDRAVRVRDIVTGAARGDGDRVIAMLPANGRPVSVSRRALAILVCRSLPQSRIASADGMVVLHTTLRPRPAPGRRVVPAAPGIARGAVFSLVSTVGPVRIVRQVTTLQPSNGGRVFVRDGDGQVFAAPLHLEESQ